MAEPTSKITDDMVVRAMISWYGVEPDEMDPEDETACADGMRTVLSAALAGCTVVQLPEPEDHDEDDDPAWDIPGEGQIVACVIEGQPFVVSGLPTFKPLADHVEEYALRLLAAAREARRLAGSVSPKGDDSNG